MKLGPLNAIHRAPDGERQGPPVLMLHGIGLGAWYWQREQERFAAHGLESWAVDLPGHGADTGADVGIEDCAHAVEQAIVELDAPPCVVGHSMGGLVAQMVAARVPVASVVLNAPVPPDEVRYFPTRDGLKALAPQLPRLALGRDLHPSEEAYRLSGLDKLPADEARRFYEQVTPWPNKLMRELARHRPSIGGDAIQAPILITHGFHDPVGSLYSSRLICDHYNCVMWRFDDIAHFPQLEPAGERHAQACAEWILSPTRRRVLEVEAFAPDEGVGSEARMARNPNPERSDSRFGKRYKGGNIIRRKLQG